MGKKLARWARPEIKQLVAGLEVTDEEVRSDSVRSFCPCHVGWDVFEQHVRALSRFLRDPNRVVRREALHVFEDAVRMQLSEDLLYYVEPEEERIGEKRACHFRSMEERLEARRNRKIQKLKKHHGIKRRSC
jgi:hypothetical protein